MDTFRHALLKFGGGAFEEQRVLCVTGVGN